MSILLSWFLKRAAVSPESVIRKMKLSTQSQHVLGEKNKTSTHTSLQNDDCWGAHCCGHLGSSGLRSEGSVVVVVVVGPSGCVPVRLSPPGRSLPSGGHRESGLQLGEKGTWPRLEIRISYRQTPKVCVNRIISQLRPLQTRMLRPGRLNELPGFLCRTGPRTQVS